jgi:hypothetical protein
MIGAVTSAHVDAAAGQLIIKAELDENDTEAVRLYSKLKKNYKLGLSVGGRATVSRGIGKSLVQDIQLDHVMVTRRPVNTQTFAYAVSKALLEAEFADAFKAVDPTAEQREAHATYFEVEDGKRVGKFPIWNRASAESALDLIGHAPPDKQDLIKTKACSILGDSRPECANLQDKNKSMEPTTEELAKAGARLSQDSIDALHDIHKNSDDGAAVRSGIETLMGDNYDPAKGFNDGDADDAEVSGNEGGNDDAIGVVEDGDPLSDMKKALAESVKSELKTYAVEIAKSIREELANKPAANPVQDESFNAARSFVDTIAQAIKL